MAYLCISPGKRGDCGVCMGETGLEDGEKLRKRIKGLGISYDRIAMDDWDSFLAAFAEDNHDTGKKQHRRDRLV
jgi:hypothetical protein